MAREHVAEALALDPAQPGHRVSSPVRVLERGAAEWPACLAHLGAGEPKRLHVRGPLSLVEALRAPGRRDGRRARAVGGGRALRAHAGARAGRGGRGRDQRPGAGHRRRLAMPAPSTARGRTVAVLGCGIDRDYPRRNAALAARIAAAGAIVSEWGPGVEPAPWRFPVRNRIVAALAQATVVIEATRRSGALITADHALAIGRDVLAVPGRAVAGARRRHARAAARGSGAGRQRRRRPRRARRADRAGAGAPRTAGRRRRTSSGRSSAAAPAAATRWRSRRASAPTSRPPHSPSWSSTASSSRSATAPWRPWSRAARVR